MSKMGSGVDGVDTRRREGSDLRLARMRRGWYVYELADRAGLTARRVHDLEDGRAFMGRAQALEAALGALGR